MDNNQSFLASHVVNILDALDDGVYVTDKEGTTLHVNAMYEKLTGLISEELLGENVRALREKGVFDVVLNPIIVKTHKPQTSVQTLQDGKRVVLRGFPVFDDQKELILVVTLVRDVTLMEQMRAQISQQKDLLSVYQNQIDLLSARGSKTFQFFEAPFTDTVIESVKQVASTKANVLVVGELGVAKSRIARLIHEHSPRKNEIFITVDCSTIPNDCIEEKLFGYVPEALDGFTSADSDGKIGPFEAADKGTLFLEEIGSLPVFIQEKLFYVIKNREVKRFGSPVIRKVNARIIASTNRDLDAETEKGSFYGELNNSIREAMIEIPPLREKPQLIPGLVKQVLEVYGTKSNKKLSCSEEAMIMLKSYSWPGNIHELNNTIQNLIITCEGNEIRPQDLPVFMQK